MMTLEHTTTATRCDRESRVTKSLLGYGVIAGPVYVVVSLAQALTRPGFDLTRHDWSVLSNGDFGWIQITNLVATGLMTVALAMGLRRAGTGRWAPRLIGTYGVCLVAAGFFRADPALGFPLGTPADAHTVSWHGMLHFLSGGVGFLCLIAACLIVGRRFAAEGERGWAIYSRITGAVFLAAFAGIASGSRGALTTLPFIAAVVLACSWITALSVRHYRRTARGTAVAEACAAA
jgi:hypothetical membrane protein